MANMGYCRFQNTLLDLQDCLDHIDDELSSDTERRAQAHLVTLCKQIAMLFDEDEDAVGGDSWDSDESSIITELRSTIAAQHDHIEDGARALGGANETIEALNEHVRLIEQKVRFQDALITQLENQLAATIATIERAAWCNACGLPAEHCRENHGQLYSEGCNL